MTSLGRASRTIPDVLVEPVSPGSQVAKLIEQSKGE